MTLQNRVLPDGRIAAIAARGMFMGNRGGRIHDPVTRQLTRRRWASKAWICCVTTFNDRHRKVMGNSYTELFFLDEVTALTAGHRPCFECQRQRALAFATAFSKGHDLPDRARAGAMDMVLHGQRTDPAGLRKIDPTDRELPDGIMMQAGDDQETFLVLRSDRVLHWTPQGYMDAGSRDDIGPAKLLTPAAMLAALRAGYQPVWHRSAEDL